MNIISEANAATRSPARLRKFWRHGLAEQFAQWQPVVTRTADGTARLEEPFGILARAAGEYAEFFLVLDIAGAGLKSLQKHPSASDPLFQRAMSRLGHAQALALLRTGSTSLAYELLRELQARDQNNVELTAALGRTWKDFAFLAATPAERSANFKRSHALYLSAYRASGEIFPGVNAAATAVWMQQPALAKKLARKVIARCQADSAGQPADYWNLATLAECHLMLGRPDIARKYYSQARALIDGTRKWANLEATRKQAERLCAGLKLDFTRLEPVFRFPKVIVFSGHMFDAPGRPHPRFPDSDEAKVRAALRKRLRGLNPGFGVTAAACGADFIFIEEMLKLGADVRVVLPWPKKEFIRSSVDLKPGADWPRRFENILEQVTCVTYLSQQTEPKATRLGYRYLMECLSGLAVFGATMLGAELVPMAVWDGRTGDGLGGTSGFVSFWREKKKAVEVVSLPRSTVKPSGKKSLGETPAEPAHAEVANISRGQETIKTMLFADVLGYTKIAERELELFQSRFMARISALIDTAPQRPIVSNTWGDAIYMVFDGVVDAGEFALRLRDLVQNTDWAAAGISTPLSLRISLHTGPVLLCVDPILRQMTITGSHVSHAARIEPKVNPGEIWTSESFAAHSAIAALDRKPGYGMEYLGQIELAKNYGAYSLFRLRSR